MRPFAHCNATSLAHAGALLRKYKSKAKLIAGGTDVLGVLKDQILVDAPEILINIKTIPGLNAIADTDQGLAIGALTRLSQLVRSAAVQHRYSLLVQAAQSVGGPEIRNMATVGGNLCQDIRCWYYRYPHSMGGRIQCRRKGQGACPALTGDHRFHAIFGGRKCFAVCPSDLAVALGALDAGIDIVGPAGQRTLPILELYGPMGTVLKPTEVVTRIQIPRPTDPSRQVFIKFRVRESLDFAIASVAVALDVQNGVCRDARIVLGAVAPTPLRATAAEAVLQEKPITPETATEAALAAMANAKPLRRNVFKVELVKTLIVRALLAADPKSP